MVLAGATQGGADCRVLDGNTIEQRYSTTSPDNFVEDLAMMQTQNINAVFSGIPPLPHVFHIHVNPFQYTRRDPQNKPELVWKDTLLIPAGNGTNSVNVYTTYKDFTGRFVMHCHILDHEDLGM